MPITVTSWLAGARAGADRTHHFEPLDQGAEVGVLLVVLDQGGLDAPAGALDVHAGPVDLCQVHALQVPQPPEEDLDGRREEHNVRAALYGARHFSASSISFWGSGDQS